MSNSRECMGVNGKALQLHSVHKKPYFLLQVMQEFVSVLQVMWESVSGTASHTRCAWTCNEKEGSYDKTIITTTTRKNITRLLPLALLLMLRTHNKTDGNKLVIFFGIALYYGDTCIIFPLHPCLHRNRYRYHWQEVVECVSCTTESCSDVFYKLPCLQCKLHSIRYLVTV